MSRKVGKNCAECGKVIHPDNRGDWSPYFCKPCDAERVRRIDGQMRQLAKDFGLSYPDDSPAPSPTTPRN